MQGFGIKKYKKILEKKKNYDIMHCVIIMIFNQEEFNFEKRNKNISNVANNWNYTNSTNFINIE